MHPSVRVVVFTCFATSLHAAEKWEGVRPILEESCYDCHNGKKTKGGVDLEKLDKIPNIEGEYALWEKVLEVIEKGDMPPEDETQLSKDEKHQVVGWIGHELNVVAMRNAGDPGPVTLRRLTNAEYDYTIRDLTGIDYGIGKEFQPDGGGGEGFANTGDTLFVNPSQLDKYLSAGRKLVDHATITPGMGVQFHPQRVGLRSPEQMKGQAQQALYVGYQKMAGPHLPTDDVDLREGDYMTACWKWKHKAQTGAASLEQLAKQAGLSEFFLNNWWTMLHNDKIQSRYLDLTRHAWHQLPGPDAAKPKEVPAHVVSGIQAIQDERRSWNNPKRPGSGIQRQQQDADGLRSYPSMNVEIKGQRSFHLVLGDIGDGNAGDYVQITSLSFRKKGKNYEYFSEMKRIRDADAKLLKEFEAGKPLPKDVTVEGLKQNIATIDTALGKFGKDPLGKNEVPPKVLAAKAPTVITLPLPEGVNQVFGAGKLDMRSPEVDQSTVQWTVRVGTPPDPSKIIPGVLTVWKRQTEAARQTMGDFNKMKSVFPDMYERRLEEVANNIYRRTPGIGVYYFNDEQLGRLVSAKDQERLLQMREDWSYIAPAKLPKDREAKYDELMRGHLHRFAHTAWRRPLSDAERGELSRLYEDSRAKGLDRESAAREVVVRVLVSPHFLFKTELNPAPPATAAAVVKPAAPKAAAPTQVATAPKAAPANASLALAAAQKPATPTNTSPASKPPAATVVTPAPAPKPAAPAPTQPAQVAAVPKAAPANASPAPVAAAKPPAVAATPAVAPASVAKPAAPAAPKPQAAAAPKPAASANPAPAALAPKPPVVTVTAAPAPAAKPAAPAPAAATPTKSPAEAPKAVAPAKPVAAVNVQTPPAVAPKPAAPVQAVSSAKPAPAASPAPAANVVATPPPKAPVSQAASAPARPKNAIQPVSAWELASRLSYFLWSSMPDWQLRRDAKDGSLLKPEVRAAHVKRMLQDPKATAFAKQFMSQWLELEGFQKSVVDTKKFPDFTPELQRDLYTETTTFFHHIIREDRPIMELITADYTYLNERLAKHYGVPDVQGNDLQKVSVGSHHRGGLLGQGSLLTKTSRSHRTSPVLRGNWLLQAVLGTPVPPPPADVPELPEHAATPATMREMLMQHRASNACSSCHDRIDPLGFALEGFDAVGRFRDKEESGLPLDTSGQVKGSSPFVGMEGLRDYLKTKSGQFEAQFSRKLLGYALGRQVLPTDKPLLESMRNALKKPEARFSTAVLAVVESKQFLNRRTE